MAITLRKLESPADHQLLQAAQEEIWGPGSGIVYDQTLTACKFGGIAVGAFADLKMIGFCYGWPAFQDGQVWFHSHLLGVFHQHRSQGLGAALKQAQREEAIRLGYARMTWTFDPLEAPNARLNIGKLGGSVRRYLVDCYGAMTDSLNGSLPSDRFLLEWDLTVPYQESNSHQHADAPLINPGGGAPQLGLTNPALRMAIPPNFRGQYEAGEQETNLGWRLQIRSASQHYFERGYAVTGFIGHTYVLTHGGSPDAH
jgi:predicted GNAT superfamily acetyltransferase